MVIQEQIIKLYESGAGIEVICTQLKIGKHKVRQTLLAEGIEIKKRGGQQRYVAITKTDITGKLIICKTCGKEFQDAENKSGSPLLHLLEHNPSLECPSAHLRRQYLKTTGNYWHLQYYNLCARPDVALLSCPACKWFSSDTENKTGALTKHVSIHHESVKSFVAQYPSYLRYFNKFELAEKREKELAQDSVVCQVCQQPLKYINQKHLFKHGMTMAQYKQLYLGQPFLSESTINKLQTSYENNLRHHENSFKSRAEEEITVILQSLGFLVLNNDKKILGGVELDLYIPSHQVAFEYNGLYYHTERMGKNRWFHLHKQNLAKEKGIKLIHIFEDEWIHKKTHCLNKILHLLKHNSAQKIYARKTTVKELNTSEAAGFLEQNHIQGDTPSKTISYGLCCDTKIVAVMSFLKVGNEWNLTRYATDAAIRCVGGASKLLNKFIRENKPLSIISFADRRWTVDVNENLYITLGFSLAEVIKPDYRYVCGTISRNMRLHKFGFRKKILLRKYPKLVNEQMTEKEMTTVLGFDRIWDCGLYKYVLKPNQV